ncbi:MAG: hypothetical protein Q9179_006010 [Wetmoreana sp. 5 TL-2023]
MAAQCPEEWCFGMVTGLQLKTRQEYVLQKMPISLSLQDDGTTLVDSQSNVEFGAISSKTKSIISVLNKELSIQIYANYAASLIPEFTSSRPQKLRRKADAPPIELSVIVYGPSSLFEPVGIFATKCNIYLQHPRYCNRNVPYHNPHCLSREDGSIFYTHDLQDQLNKANPTAFEAPSNPIDVLLDSAQQEQLSEAFAPDAVRTTLYPHQRQALTFMMQRESGWAMDGRYKDIWKAELDAQGQSVYINHITGQRQMRPPQEFRGGLLIDAPGLGKSLSIIALIAADLENRKSCGQTSDERSQTLLVVPKSLIETWKDELQNKKEREKLLKNLKEYALVITTYSVVRLDWQANDIDDEQRNQKTLHNFTWRRVVLDEAHTAREPARTFARSVCALRAERRWAVTGTPIQNKLTDLYSLFKFLQCSPFSDLRVFNKHVTQNWKAISDPYSVAKLKNLVTCLSIRRPKDTIALRSRQDCKVEVELDSDERQLYQSIRSSAERNRSSAERNLCNTDDGADAGAFFNALKEVNQLRLICNHGLHGRTSPSTVTQLSGDQCQWTQQAAQSRFDHLDAVGLAKCSNPGCGQDLSSALSSELDHEHEDEPWIDEALTVLCSTCNADRAGRSPSFLQVCNHFPRRSPGEGNPEAQGIFDAEDAFSVSQMQPPAGGADYVPSKIKQVVQDLLGSADDVKRLALRFEPEIHADILLFSVVFSSWTKTLDILQRQLWARSIRCVRLDGNSSMTSRAGVLRAFRGNSGIKVLLATISCGGVGLDLTAASRAYIIEPQWNPMSESQALDRIHRLGQTKEVTTIRYVTKGTWEERVVTLQRKKQELADLTLGSGAINKAELTYGRLQYLKQLVG